MPDERERGTIKTHGTATGRYDDEHDGGPSAHYARLAGAEGRLAQFAMCLEKNGAGDALDRQEFPYDDEMGWKAMAEDIRLILSELSGLKQFDLR